MKLTVFFEEPYWVGIVETEKDGKLFAGRHIFGAEPSLPEVWQFVLHRLPALADRLSCGVDTAKSPLKTVSPKRLARLAAKESRARGVSTASQEAIRQEIELRKRERTRLGKEQREAAAERKREIAVRKAKAKHRGR
ncbi:YjdF family protein [Paenibacillus sp. USDA918EY]|uniref:YjdF family protein n=1 Tax=Paenibacillus sp. USDA918EY TaxID=2689575 RepID=UPI0013582D91|nr:YjdF family protein [Paenibacillus sp. USDA918EY]